MYDLMQDSFDKKVEMRLCHTFNNSIIIISVIISEIKTVIGKWKTVLSAKIRHSGEASRKRKSEKWKKS